MYRYGRLLASIVSRREDRVSLQRGSRSYRGGEKEEVVVREKRWGEDGERSEERRELKDCNEYAKSLLKHFY